MLAAYLLAFLVVSGHVDAETAWPWALSTSSACEDAGVDAPACVRFLGYALGEGGFATRVLSGACNREHRGCDFGHAFGPWQVHPDDAHTTGAELLAPSTSPRAALRYWIHAPYAWSTWRTGETFARAWMKRNPLVLVP